MSDFAYTGAMLRLILLMSVVHLHGAPFRICEQPVDYWVNRKLHEGFSQHAREQVGTDGNIQQISFVAKRGNAFAGAIVAQTFWGALHIQSLYLEPKWRGQGLGKALLQEVLKRGKERGCRFAYVETMHFQAVDFYKKLGFEEEFVRSGYDKECSYHYLKIAL